MKAIKTFAILILALSAITLNSCKKDKDTLKISLTADVDGTATNFNVSPMAVTGKVQDESFTVIQGATSTGAIIAITVQGKITAGKTFSDAASSDDDKPLFIYATSSTDDDYLNDDDVASNLPSITITSITSTSIEGTFKGNVVKGVQVGNNPLPKKAITNGKFSVKLQSQSN